VITRYYFMKLKKMHSDGSGSYSFHESIASRKSLFPQPLSVCAETFDYLTDKLKDKPEGIIEVMAFNRL